ncbi:MAG: hypothetical protein FJ088_11950, partial [Deltaproteobacteria bacterium]|nr:hypothetical protein [Deltaproteobacteria bacterium]
MAEKKRSLFLICGMFAFLDVSCGGLQGGKSAGVLTPAGGLSDVYCAFMKGDGGKFQMSFEMKLTFSGENFTAAGENASMMKYDLKFSGDRQTFSGEYEPVSGDLPPGTITGWKGNCPGPVKGGEDADYILPVADLTKVSGARQYKYKNTHEGIDFEFESDASGAAILMEIVSPCDGIIFLLYSHKITDGTHIIDLGVRCAGGLAMIVTFEPDTTVPEVIERQWSEISVSITQAVKKGSLLGRLLIPPDAGRPHVHWIVFKNILTAAK